jgi:PAS domain-containing protein
MLLFQSSRDAIMTIKPLTWNFNSGNLAALKMFNVKDEKQFLTLSLADLSPEKQGDGQLSSIKAKKMIEQAMKDGTVFFEWTHRRYRGKDFKATVLLSRVDVKNGPYLQATVRDIEAEKKMIEKVKRNMANKKL